MYHKTILLVAAIVLSFLYSCNHAHKATDEHGHEEETEKKEAHEHNEIIFSKEQAKDAGLQLETIQPADFSDVIKSSGQVLSAPGDEVTVVATTNGIISYSSLALTNGSAVKKGQPLFSISAKKILNGDPVAQSKIEFETAKLEFERAEALAKDKIISQRELEQARLRFETAKSVYSGLASSSGGNGVSVSSSISGFIKNRLVEQGEYVSVGQPVAVVSQNKRLVLQAEVSERYFNQLKNIKTANFKLPYDNQQVFKLTELNGRLLSFGKSSAENSYYLPISFEFDNIGDIVPGSYAEIYLLSNPRHEVLSVPISALTEDQGVYYVYTQLDDEGYQKHEVKIGSTNGERAEILEGLKAGQKVVTQGAMQIKMASATVAPTGHNHNH